MAIRRSERTKKQKLGQFMTPSTLSASIVKDLAPTKESTVLEPSFGEGSFIFAYIDYLLSIDNPVDRSEYVQNLLRDKISGVEFDADLYAKTIERLSTTYNIPSNFAHNLVNSDFFDYDVDEQKKFDIVIGNPPFGGTFERADIDQLDRKYGKWGNYKIKKETYAFFISKCLRLLNQNARLAFILSDTFLTIKTMEGLRRYLMHTGDVSVIRTQFFSEETNWDMVTLELKKKETPSTQIVVDGKTRTMAEIEQVKGFSWGLTDETLQYFTEGIHLSDYIIASSGMTVGKNEFFLRTVTDKKITETFSFEVVDRFVTVEEELSKARLNVLSPEKLKKIQEAEAALQTYKDIKIEPLESAVEIELTDYNTYKPYNKAETKEKYYTHVKNVVFWKNNGEAVLYYKKNGPWYLHGVGGAKFFEKEGITWPLISSTIKAKYLPKGFILDSGAPIAILKPGIPSDELFFILGWLWTDEATMILKTVINHTRNIQSKDIERIPYPSWVNSENKKIAVEQVKSILELAKTNDIKKADILAQSLSDRYRKTPVN